MAQPLLVARVMTAFVEPEARHSIGTHARTQRCHARQHAGRRPQGLDRPAGEHARQLRDILLTVACVDAQRVQLHQFTGVILVQPAPRAATRRDALPVVQVIEHGRMLGGGPQQVAKAPEGMGPDRLMLVVADQHPHQVLALEDVEMVEPEIDHDFFELARTLERPPQARRDRRPLKAAHILGDRGRDLAWRGIRAAWRGHRRRGERGERGGAALAGGAGHGRLGSGLNRLLVLLDACRQAPHRLDRIARDDGGFIQARGQGWGQLGRTGLQLGLDPATDIAGH